jgi:hypothetical protein
MTYGPQRGKPQSANTLESELGPGQTGQPENATMVVVGPKHAQVPCGHAQVTSKLMPPQVSLNMAEH